MTASDLFIQALVNEGVEMIFGVPGEENVDFLEAVRKSRRLRFIPTRHEQSAAFMADVSGRLTGKAGVCLATLGPGATNLVTGIADANLDRAPLIAITGQLPLSAMHKESHQFIDVIKLMEPITKWTTRVTNKESIPEVVRKAFKVAEAEKPGATHIELPEDIARASVDAARAPIPATRVRRGAPDYKAIAEAWKAIKHAKKPLVLAGNGCVRKRASKQLNIFLKATGIPIVNTFMAKGAAHHIIGAQNLQTVGFKSRDYVACAIEASDCVIAIGYDLVEYAPQYWNRGEKKTIVHIDFFPAEVDEHYHADVEVVADIAYSLWALNEHVREKAYRVHAQWSSWIATLHGTFNKEMHAYDNDDAWPVKPQRIIADIRRVLRDDDVLISDVGAHKMWIARHYEAREPNSCIISNGFASMGIALPGAIAAKMLFPKKTVLAAVGDGGFMMAVHELETAVRLKLPIVVLIWRDDSYGVIGWHQRKKFGKTFGVNFGNPDFVQLAESFGAIGVRVQKTEGLLPILKKAAKAKRPVVIDCPVDYRENMKLTDRLTGMVCPI